MARTSDAALIVDDNWQAAEELRKELEAHGVTHVHIAFSDRLVLLEKEYFPVSFVCTPKRIEQDPEHPLNQSVRRHFPAIPVVSYSPDWGKGWLPPKLHQLTGGRGLSQ